MSKANIVKRSIGDLCKAYYIDYGKELNNNRALPFIMDGLKPSYRRAIYTALKSPGNHIKSLDFVGSMFKIHPHSDKSIIGVETKLVRSKVFKELGNFGYYPIYGESSGAAAPRYTMTGIEDNWYNIMSPLIDLVPYIEGEVEEVLEPSYLPTCIPLSLVFGSVGIGLGINTNIPSFSPYSLLKAYLNNDPSLLEPYYDLEIDYELSDLQRLWTEGRGTVIYKYHVDYGEDMQGNDGVYITGDTQLFTPDWSIINDWKSQGLIFTRDESTGGVNRLFIGRNKGVRKVNQEMIYEECVRCTSTYNVFSEIQTMYRLGVNDRKQARYIPMYEWIDIVYKNYLNLIDKYKETNIDRLNFDKKVVLAMKPVAELLMNSVDMISNEDIASQLDLDIEVVNAVCRKSISTLRRSDTEHLVQSIEGQIKEFEDIESTKFINDTIAQM